MLHVEEIWGRGPPEEGVFLMNPGTAGETYSQASKVCSPASHLHPKGTANNHHRPCGPCSCLVGSERRSSDPGPGVQPLSRAWHLPWEAQLLRAGRR